MKEAFHKHARELCDKVANFQALKDLIDEWRHFDFVTKTPVPAILNFMVRLLSFDSLL
jgi:hypothetical protein